MALEGEAFLPGIGAPNLELAFGASGGCSDVPPVMAEGRSHHVANFPGKRADFLSAHIKHLGACPVVSGDNHSFAVRAGSLDRKRMRHPRRLTIDLASNLLGFQGKR